MLTILLPSLLLLPQDPGAAKPATEFVPLRPLCGQQAFDYSPVPVWGSLLRWVTRDERSCDLMLHEEDLRTIEPDNVVEMLNHLERESVDGGTLFFEAVGDNLLAVGDRDAVLRSKQLVEQATRVVARPLNIELVAWDATDLEAPEGVLDPEAFSRFAGNRTPLWRAVGTGTASETVVLEHMQWTRYVRGIEVEVAQKQSLSRPATDRYGVGGHAIVRAYSLVGGDDFAVHAQFAYGARRGVVRSLQIGLPGGADLELPQLESWFGTCSGRIANGGALAVTMRGDAQSGGQLVLTLRVVARTPPAGIGRPGVALLPCGALTHPALTQRVGIPDANRDHESDIGYERSGVFGYLEPDHLVDLARNLAGDEEHASIHYGGGHLVVIAPAATVARIEGFVRGLQDRLLRNVVVRHTAHVQGAPPNGTNEAPASPLTELTTPTLLGREAVAFRLFETNVVRDVFIEIAAEAGTLVPDVAALQTGTWLRACVVPTADDLHLDLDVQAVNAPPPPIRSVMPGGGVLMPAAVDAARVGHDGIVRIDQAVEHGDGPSVSIEGRLYRTSLSTMLTR